MPPIFLNVIGVDYSPSDSETFKGKSDLLSFHLRLEANLFVRISHTNVQLEYELLALLVCRDFFFTGHNFFFSLGLMFICSIAYFIDLSLHVFCFLFFLLFFIYFTSNSKLSRPSLI